MAAYFEHFSGEKFDHLSARFFEDSVKLLQAFHKLLIGFLSFSFFTTLCSVF
jgi:hypothetical protein